MSLQSDSQFFECNRLSSVRCLCNGRCPVGGTVKKGTEASVLCWPLVWWTVRGWGGGGGLLFYQFHSCQWRRTRLRDCHGSHSVCGEQHLAWGLPFTTFEKTGRNKVDITALCTWNDTLLFTGTGWTASLLAVYPPSMWSYKSKENSKLIKVIAKKTHFPLYTNCEISTCFPHTLVLTDSD